MEYRSIGPDDFEQLKRLQTAYKQEIGEDLPSPEGFSRLRTAMESGIILFYGCLDADRLIGCCSVSPTFSTFGYRRSGVFEDFYILTEYRHRGIAAELVRYAFRQSGVSTLTVGCADCDIGMYRALGFSIPLGNMLAYNV